MKIDAGIAVFLLITIPILVFYKKPMVGVLVIVGIVVGWLIFSKSEVRNSIVYTYLPNAQKK